MKIKIQILLILLTIPYLAATAQVISKETSEKTQTVRSRTEPLKVGQIASDFTLTDENGKQVTLSKAKQPVVLVFYRGYW